MANSMRQQIDLWLLDKKGWFNYSQLDKALNIAISSDKTLRRVIIFKMVKDGVLIRNGYRKTTFRRAY